MAACTLLHHRGVTFSKKRPFAYFCRRPTKISNRFLEPPRVNLSVPGLTYYPRSEIDQDTRPLKLTYCKPHSINDSSHRASKTKTTAADASSCHHLWACAGVFHFLCSFVFSLCLRKMSMFAGFAILLVVLLLVHQRTSKRGKPQPTFIPEKIPFLSHAIGIARHGASYYKSIRFVKAQTV